MVGDLVGEEKAKSRLGRHRVPRSCPLLLALYVSFSVIATMLIVRRFEDSKDFQVHRCPEFQSPSSLPHNMSDKELFELASCAWKLSQHKPPTAPKIAFMFLTRGPIPLAPLWENFFLGHEGLYSIYVHPPPRFKAEFPSSSVFHSRQITSQVANWGRISVCDAEKRLLANAMLDISNQWFILLSESCIPLYSFNHVHGYVTKSKYSFVHAFRDEGLYFMFNLGRGMRPLIDISKWRKGYQWFVVDRNVGIKMVSDTTYYPKFSKFCKAPCFPDEHYFQTMLSIEVPHLMANRSLTWVNWSVPGPHPITYNRQDVTIELIRTIRSQHNCSYNDHFTSTCYLFARKFSPTTLESLLQIFQQILGF